ncbi:MAG: DUF1134 domain-containing protein [Hyphomicrobiaceae bacterium]|nr:MAG: DUF1134 domain-containing protein [Hyphomicrobiaceae bacterium]
MASAVVVCALIAASQASAASCTKEDFALAVDRAGAALRKVNADNTPRLQAKMRQLKEAKGWPDAGFEEKAYAALQDERIAGFDAQANDLLAKIDQLGTADPASEGDCAKLEELTAASLELQATVKAKAAYTMAKIEQMLAGPPVAVPAPVPSEPKSAEPRPKTAEVPRKAAPPPAQPKPAPKSPVGGGWATQTQGDPPAEVAVAQPPLPTQPVGPPAVVLSPDEEGYTIDEIKAASAGLFGKLSANLGAVIEHVFSQSGRPTGYILGTEGGGAFLAGVRYGNGTLYLRSGGTQKIFWHGPSVGTDVGADGSKTLFLIYKLKAADELYASFTGIDGSAYLVGGVGATLVTNGRVVLAPIRSGVGLRLGANIGYIRFTPKATWNPF